MVGTGRLPTADDRLHMPYTNATICEIQRYSDIGTMGAPHSPTEDVTIRGYTIPKGMMVFPVQHTTHYDPAVWKNPAAFDPTNFLDDNGKFVPSPKLIPFSMGKVLSVYILNSARIKSGSMHAIGRCKELLIFNKIRIML